MARIKRIVISNTPHYVTQRGVHSMNIFFKHDDYDFLNNVNSMSLKLFLIVL